MIATRRRRMHFPFKRYLKMLIFGIVCYELYSVPLTHKLIFDGPLKPIWKQVGDVDHKYLQPYTGPVLAPMIKPLHFAFQQRQLIERSHQLTVIKATLVQQQMQVKNDSKKISELQHKLAASKNVSKAKSSSTTSISATPAVAVTPSPDDMKTATYWSSMESETAAQVAQKLAPVETARVFLAMKPDQVAEIMNALPVDYNVKLKAVHLEQISN